jgi:hypothetical protein
MRLAFALSALFVTCQWAYRPDRGQTSSPRAHVATPGPQATGHNARARDAGERRATGAGRASVRRIAANRRRCLAD